MLAWVSKKETAMASRMIEGMMYTLGGGFFPKTCFSTGSSPVSNASLLKL